MPLQNRSLDRDKGILRDANIVVIASEDTYAIKDYFRRFRTKKVQFEVLETEDGNSSPVAVLKRIDYFRSTVATEPGDEFWVCIDADHWLKAGHGKNLGRVLKECREKKYRVAFCNPCIELWFLLHFADFEAPAEGEAKCKDAESQLSNAVGGYSKAKCKRLVIGKHNVEEAIRRAKALDGPFESEHFPRSPVARVYKIVEYLIEHDQLHIG
ncbi:RloB family protein [Blastopirellula marina]|uniref:RloB family protein n=1 Tax=Blastopirellula marina TaxID=124 RepID=UPI001304F377|nr:RloB family protein [Blastopirellula marina]